MKIAHLDTGRTWRGGQAQVALLMRGLRERGCHGLLLAPEAPLLERMRREGFETIRWETRGEWDLGAALTARATLARARPDVVHIHTARAHALGVPAARAAGVPVVVVSRRVDFGVGGNPLSALKYRLPVDRYLCISRGVMRVMEDAGIPPERLALVPSGVALPAGPEEVQGVADLRALVDVPARCRIVGTVAALAPHKNHMDLLAAAATVVEQLADVHFVWIGEGERRQALLRRRSELGLEGRVHLLGFRSDARELLREFSVFALASYLEGLCTSLLDAQVRRVPVVATAVGGIPDLIEDRVSGRLVPPRDPIALAHALIEALEQPAQARAWAERAYVAAQAFSAGAMVERTLAQYATLVGAKIDVPPTSPTARSDQTV